MEILKRFSRAEKISRGMSADEKYKVIGENGEAFLLRLSPADAYDDKAEMYEKTQKLYKCGIPVPQPVEFGRTDDGVYSLTEWIEGEILETALGKKSRDERYALGIASGTILKSVHSCGSCDMRENWLERYLEVIEPRIAAFRKEGIPFDGDGLILDYFEKNKGLLESRPQVLLHGDYHMGNMILSDSNKVVIVDWDKVDFDGVGDPWYEFNRIGVEYAAFAKGQIDGYFGGNVPEEFWKLLALYMSVSAITSIVWAKYYAPDELENIMSLNRNVLAWFDNMNNPVPSWYRKFEIC